MLYPLVSIALAPLEDALNLFPAVEADSLSCAPYYRGSSYLPGWGTWQKRSLP